MNAGAEPVFHPEAPQRRSAVMPLVELVALAAAIGIAVASYYLIAGHGTTERLLSPPLVALLLVANIVPGVALMVLLGRRVARARAARSPGGGEGRLHVRLVVLVSIMSTVPLLLVAVAASLLFQFGVEFWSSERARGMLENATSLVRENYQQELDRVAGETSAMGVDLSKYLATLPTDGPQFSKLLFLQTYHRNLSEAMIIRAGEPDPLAVLNPYGRPLKNLVTPAMMTALDRGAPQVIVQSKDRAGALVRLAAGEHTYLYAARIFDEQLGTQLKRGDAIMSDYRALRSRARVLQLKFNLALVIVSLVIVGVAVWIALQIADRLVQPVDELVGAARRVAGGDLTARVAAPRTRDEVGTLARAFNRMTERLEQQNTALVTANDQLENRRALIEAVMSGVSAGVVATDRDRRVRIINRSALALLGAQGEGPVGRPLAALSPELDTLVADGLRESVVQVEGGGEARTLAVRIARADDGPILTFDDITQQLQDQRRAAWADVARRIAHEIKNPLTPIQLAAERLQRRYGKTVEEGDTTFARLTDTIVRQVGDLRRMVDEFSSFARMPKPVFRTEVLADIVRQTLFLHEVAHPAIRFTLDLAGTGPSLVCDRRQIGQAMTNLVKNAIEAIEARGDGVAEAAVVVTLAQSPGEVVATVADTGIGLPAERDRIVEPYMTTRARGTGLGLAIVKKIIEEHFGTICFSDRDGGGTMVTMSFDTTILATLDDGDAAEAAVEHERPLAVLTPGGS